MKNSIKTIFYAVLLSLAMAGCGDTSSSSSKPKLDGVRYKAVLVRASDETSWVAIKGGQEWWIFSANVFRQISTDYVEPQFYGENQACNGSGSGSWTSIEPAEGEAVDERKKTLSFAYDGLRDVRGLCRMTDRSIQFTIQPSGVVDMLDGKRVVRLEVMEKIQ